MKRSTLTLLAATILAAAATQPAHSATKPVTSTYYFHGSGNGNVSAIQASTGGGGGVLPMDSVKPTATSDSEYGSFGAANNPNHKCYGNPLTMHPTWMGAASGMLTNKVVVSFYARSSPGNATVQLFADAGDSQACNANFPSVVAEATVPLPASPSFQLVTATLTLAKPVKVKAAFSIQIQTEDVATPQASDIGFDSAASPSGVTWSCIPAAGKKAC